MADRFENDPHKMEGSQESAPPVQEETEAPDAIRPPRNTRKSLNPAKPERRTNGPKPGKLPPWKVVLHNDNVNTMQDVVLAILQLTPLSEQAATRRMIEAHLRGRALLMTTHRERAELYKQQFAGRRLRVSIGPA